jgi:hypothetical protein
MRTLRCGSLVVLHAGGYLGSNEAQEQKHTPKVAIIGLAALESMKSKCLTSAGGSSAARIGKACLAVDTVTASEKAKLDSLLTEFMIHTGSSFNMIENQVRPLPHQLPKP